MPGLLENQEPPNMGESPEISAQAKPYLDQAVELLYDKNFENLVKMFQQHGEQGFADAVSIAINGVLDRLEKDQGELSLEILAEVGTKLIEMLLQDLMQGGIIQNVTKEMLMGAIGKTIGTWGKNHPNRANPQEFEQAIQQAMGGQAMSQQQPMGAV